MQKIYMEDPRNTLQWEKKYGFVSFNASKSEMEYLWSDFYKETISFRRTLVSSTHFAEDCLRQA